MEIGERVQVRAVEEERVRRGNAGERYLFLSLEVKWMKDDKRLSYILLKSEIKWDSQCLLNVLLRRVREEIMT